MDEVEFIEVESSNINAIGYDPDLRAIFVKFRDGTTYQYDECPLDLWAAFLGAASKGKFVHQYLKSHPSERVKG